MSEPLLKPEYVAKLLSVSRAYIYKLIATGMLPAIIWKVPGAGQKRKVVRVKMEDVEEFKMKYYTKHLTP